MELYSGQQLPRPIQGRPCLARMERPRSHHRDRSNDHDYEYSPTSPAAILSHFDAVGEQPSPLLGRPISLCFQSRRDGLRIAQPFKVGFDIQNPSSPEGTTETSPLHCGGSAVPSGLGPFLRVAPKVETLGYCRLNPSGIKRI